VIVGRWCIARRAAWYVGALAASALLLAAPAADAQPARATGASVADSAGRRPLTFAAFRERVLANHPVAVQARQAAAGGRAELTFARGGFDPKLEFARDRKVLGGTEYFDYVDAALKIPTFIGSDLKLAFERTAGTFINPDRRTSDRGLLTLGMTVPLGQRIITDERRTALAQARAARDAGDAERDAMLNKLIFSAAKDYGSWYEATERLRIATEGVALARFRLAAVQERLVTGFSPAVDTLEAALELNRREVTLREASAGYYAARQAAESYLWDERGVPVPLGPDDLPVLDGVAIAAPDTTRLSALRAEAERSHPDVRKAEAKLRSVDAERLLATQAVLPFAELSLNSLAGRDDRGALTDRDAWDTNQKVGFYASTPLLFFKERGKLAMTGAKQEAARAERDFVRRLIGLTLNVAANDLAILADLQALQTRNVTQASLLRDAEQERFLNGESTLLVVNLRERLVLDELVKRASIEAKGVSALAALGVALGDFSRLSEFVR
jgi:outer membrane protein TolC